jgi:TolB-like protein
LEVQGLKCWIAPRDVTPGAHYAGEIVHAIDSSKAIVLILSQDAATSPHVLREIERATSKRHPVVTLRVDQAPLPAEFEYFLNTSQWLDASGGDASRMIPKLVAAVKSAIKAPAVTPAATSSSHVPARSASTRSKNRTALAVACVVGLTIAGVAADRLWLARRRAAAVPAPTAPVSAPLSAPAAPTISDKSVAVLPFLDMSEKRDQEYFSDGLSEELIDMLTKVQDLRVPARTSSFYFKGKQTTIVDIAKALSVANILEGSVRKSGNTLRVTAQLIRADTGYHVWSETYERKLDDIFKIQDEIADAVVTALKVSLLETEKSAAPPTTNLEAYSLYVQARAMRSRGTVTDMKKAADYLQRAVRLDPKFASAWALLTTTNTYQYEMGSLPFEQAREVTSRAAQQALELAPTLGAAHLSMARVHYFFDWDWHAAGVEIQRARQLDPRDAEAIRWAGISART